ncbi:MAG: hypothetical protein ACOCP4_02005 [Candidatus Woesearchaeota archaeon]
MKNSELRPFRKYITSGNFKKYYNNIFNGKDRVYFDFTPECKNIWMPEDMRSWLENNNLTPIDYRNMSFLYGSRNIYYNIRCFANKIQDQDLLSMFNENYSPINNFKIVISRHPIDIIYMSTYRRWTSCTAIFNGKMWDCIFGELEDVSLISYIIYDYDINILDPISRIMIKPYYNKEKNKTVLYPEYLRVHGVRVPGYRKAITNILQKYQDFDIERFSNNNENYYVSPNVFSDFMPNIIGPGDPNGNYEERKLYKDLNT